MGVLRFIVSWTAATLLLAATVGASPAPVPSSLAATATKWCPIAVYVTTLDATRVAVHFWTPLPGGLASGIVALTANGSRYDVRFADELVPHRGLRIASSPRSTTLVVRFPAPVRVDSAAVTSLDAPARGPCNPLYGPWSSQGRDQPIDPAGDASAANVVVHDAPAPIPYTPATCGTPFAPPGTVSAAEPRSVRYNGTVYVSVTVGADGKTTSADLPEPSGSAAADTAAKDAAARSTFSPQIFNCEPVAGTYTFGVVFSVAL